jgi:hypothetical protein
MHTVVPNLPPRELKLEAAGKKLGQEWILNQPPRTRAIVALGVIVIACQGEDLQLLSNPSGKVKHHQLLD